MGSRIRPGTISTCACDYCHKIAESSTAELAWRCHFPDFLPERCVRALAAADFAAAGADFDANVRPAAAAALLPVDLEFPLCARVLAAADFAAVDDALDDNVFAAAVAAGLLVLSFFATTGLSLHSSSDHLARCG